MAKLTDGKCEQVSSDDVFLNKGFLGFMLQY